MISQTSRHQLSTKALNTYSNQRQSDQELVNIELKKAIEKKMRDNTRIDCFVRTNRSIDSPD